MLLFCVNSSWFRKFMSGHIIMIYNFLNREQTSSDKVIERKYSYDGVPKNSYWSNKLHCNRGIVTKMHLRNVYKKLQICIFNDSFWWNIYQLFHFYKRTANVRTTYVVAIEQAAGLPSRFVLLCSSNQR